ncbi:MAG: ABC transporter ATP-binding protein, partial [Anaerococcus sp.]|nr:ABC transporter ATP-binding protein [Anaerococcus sp.]
DQNNKNVKSLSLGMKQRLAIAMAMVNSPKLLILDEPINGLDPQGIIDIRKTLQDINKKYGTTIIISSHILDELARLATDFGIISHGKLIAEFSSKDLHDRCQSKIEITCNDVKKASYILRKNAYQNEIISNNKLILIDYFNKTHLINSLLVNNSIDVYSIYLTEMSFEDYYMEVIQNEKSN